MKLELKHLAPYLPYDLQFLGGHWLVGLSNLDIANYDKHDQRMIFCANEKQGKVEWEAHSEMVLPILRPLSDLTKDKWKEEIIILHESMERDIKVTEYHSGNDNPNDFGLTITYKLMDDVFTESLVTRGNIKDTRYYFTQWLFEWHFDVFGLIEQGLAIDKNTL